MIDNITYARGRAVELQDEIAENNSALLAIKRDIIREVNTTFCINNIRFLLNKAELFEAEIKKASDDLGVLKRQWGLK